MKKQLVFVSSILLTLATSAIPFATVADAAVVRHHFVQLTAAHGGHANGGHGGHGGWVGGGWTAENSATYNGRMDNYYNGYGSYRGDVGDFCGTIAWTLDLCGPHGP
ncbi:Uncharacterized protein MLTONO_6460 [Mesorhizobium loti]|nr:Uncharacterized protein MLTONO_6460 [Mesorhizobium loti]